MNWNGSTTPATRTTVRAQPHEARIYWDAGTGEVDFSEPHATVEMGSPTQVTRHTWTSEALTNEEEYRFAVRIATAAWPDGVETQNTEVCAATADATSPSAPDLSAYVV